MNNGYELSRQWFDWSFENPDKATANHCALYMWLIEINNRLGWVDKFQITSTECMQGMCCKSYKTYKKCFDDLVEWNFVTITTQSKNQYQCNIIALVKNTKAHTKALTKALLKHLPKQVQSTDQSTDQSTSHIHKPINQQTNKPQTYIRPTLDEVYNYMGEQVAKKMLNWDDHKLNLESEKFFNHYESNGWIQNGNKPIKKWQAAVINWILNTSKFENNKSQKINSNEQRTHDFIAKYGNSPYFAKL